MRETMVVAGGGLVGLCTAAAIARRGMRCTLVSERRPGEASPAAAGMLAPGVEHATGPAHDFGIAARDHYPEFLAWLERATGVKVPHGPAGILQVASSEEEAARLAGEASLFSRWLAPEALRKLEPALGPAPGALLHEYDGAVDNEILVQALRQYVASAGGITVVEEAVVRIEGGLASATVHCESGRQYGASAVVVATGAWTAALAGLPRALPVEPVRGQMLELSAAPLRHVAFAGGGYLVPRASGTTLIGSTMERVGYDTTVTAEARSRLLGIASAAAPTLGAARVLRHWAGLRPLTPDLQPIVGRDPDQPNVVYACGHSRNGILMAPLTGEVVATLLAGETPGHDLTAFSPSRFSIRQ